MDSLGADALRSGEADPRCAETFGLVVGKSPSRLLKGADERVGRVATVVEMGGRRNLRVT